MARFARFGLARNEQTVLIRSQIPREIKSNLTRRARIGEYAEEPQPPFPREAHQI